MKQKGFTLLEILLVVAMIAILAGIVIIAINPTKQLADTRNAQRRSDVATILNAVYQYSIDHKGALPVGSASSSSIDTYSKEICASTIPAVCASNSLVDLSALYYSDQKYLVNIPIDPSMNSVQGTGYYIWKSNNNRITVKANNAEQDAVIQVSR
jgi:type IV pilus assembly protein PilA